MSKLYLGFVYSTEWKVGLHCTHCYFGELEQEQTIDVIKTTDRFFNDYGPITLPTITFNVPKIFADSGVRVLATQDSQAFRYMNQLRDIFQAKGLLNTTYPFRPHVTTKTIGSIGVPFCAYALICDGKLVKAWRVHQRQEAMCSFG